MVLLPHRVNTLETLKVAALAVFTDLAAHANILWLLFLANDFVPVSLLKGLVEETAFEFQLVRCALFLVLSEVCGADELIRVRLTFGILKLFPRGFQPGVYGDSSVSGLDRKRTQRETT